MRQTGFELEFISTSRPIPLFGVLKHDASVHPSQLRGGTAYEWASPIAETQIQLNALIDSICTTLHQCGSYVNESCGAHIHLYMAEATSTECANLQSWWLVMEPLFFALVPKTRRGCSYSGAVTKIPGCATSRGGGVWTSDRYFALNIAAMAKWGTYEVRLLQGTIDPQKIKGWISFFQHFFNTFTQIPQSQVTKLTRFNNREKLRFLFQQTALTLSLRKWVVRTLRKYNSGADALVDLSALKYKSLSLRKGGA